MQIDHYTQGMQMIGQYFGRPYKSDSIKAIWEDVKNEPDKAVDKAFIRVEIDFHQAQVVPIARIRDLILTEGKKIREAEICQREQLAEKMKREEQKPWNPGADEHGKACAAFLTAAFSGQYSHDQLREMAEDGERRFPGRGFDAWLNGALRPKVVEMRRRAAGE
jgi:hypothetical protein